MTFVTDVLRASDTVAHVIEDCPALAQEREAAGVGTCLELCTKPADAAEFLRVAGLV